MLKTMDSKSRRHINVYHSWRNRNQRYSFRWYTEDGEMCIGDDSERTYCPICGKYKFLHEFDICPWCKWEHDMVQEEDPDYDGGANKMSLNQAREAYRRGGKVI